MTTSKGTIQGFNGITAVDKKHQVIIDAQAFGSGQEQHTLQPVVESIKDKYQRLGISENIYQNDTIVTADTGFANEANMKYLNENDINAYIPDNQFRSRDPKFSDQKETHGKRHQNEKSKHQSILSANEFDFDPVNQTCHCPAGETMWLKADKHVAFENRKLFFVGRLSICQQCELKHRCMRNPDSANLRTGSGRQVSFIITNAKRPPNCTDWMKLRVDSDKGKEVYSHRMSVVDRLLLLHNLRFRRPWRSTYIC